jgi:polyprenyl-phospho-N-acetylgalactosaminyl synthase
MTDLRPCCLVPTFDNPATLRQVVERVRLFLSEVVVVDDGSAEPGRTVAEELAREGLAHLTRRPRNGGKGAAVKTGFETALQLGYTHALQIDADGQHDLADIPKFLEASTREPRALILGAPRFDGSVPASRLKGRELTRFWTHLEIGSKLIEDPMCGFRIYPLAAAARANARGNRMDFDPEIAVRLVWQGVPVVNLPTRVRYLSKEEGGVSHFRLIEDNLRISWMHTRLVILAMGRWLARQWHRRAP